MVCSHRSLVAVSVLVLFAVLPLGADGARKSDRESLAIDPADIPKPPSTTVERRVWTPSGVERFYLPVLGDEPGKGFNCFYKAPKFTASVDENGALQVQLLSGKEPAGKPWIVGGSIAGSYTQPLTTGKAVGIARYMVSVRSNCTPTAQPRNKVIIEGELEEDVQFKRTYTFQTDKIVVTTGFRCRNALPTTMGMAVYFPACAAFEPDVPNEDRKTRLEGHQLEVRVYEGKRRKDTTFEYWSNKFSYAATDLMTARGPWEERAIELKTRDPIMYPWIYTGNCLYQGYRMHITVGNDTLRSLDYKLTVGIE